MPPKVVSQYKIHYHKFGRDVPKIIDLDHLEKQYSDLKLSQKQNEPDEYNPFQITGLQLYNPIYNLFFELTENNIQRISLNHPLHMDTLTTIFDTNERKSVEKPVFIKYSPLLNPVRYMIGKYSNISDSIKALPGLGSADSPVVSHNNTSYVDCFFSYLASVLLNHHGFVHGVDYYGSYLGVQKLLKHVLPTILIIYVIRTISKRILENSFLSIAITKPMIFIKQQGRVGINKS